MIKSMTGFGAARIETDSVLVSVEVKSLNSKYNDIGLKLPNIFSSKEIEVRNLLSEKLMRGKISFQLSYSTKSATAKMQVNKPIVEEYYKTLREMAEHLNAPDTDIFRMVMLMPEAYISNANEEAIEDDWKVVRKAIDMGIKACDDFRKDEGKKLGAELKSDAEHIRTLLAQVIEHDPRRMARVKERLQQQVAELASNEQFDQNRFEQELIYYIEKYDINEEKVRLTNHIDYFIEALAEPESNGKKLGFISQEMGREINTIGSKANDYDVQRLVVGMKESLEKIKEQALNIL